MGGVIQRMKKEFRFATMDDIEWKVQTEMDFMREYKLVYLNDLGKKVLGCVARQATRSMIDLSHCLNCVGQTQHKCILSKRAPNRTGGGERARNVVGNTFHPSFVRVSRGNSAIAQQHLGKRKAWVGSGSSSGGTCCHVVFSFYLTIFNCPDYRQPYHSGVGDHLGRTEGQ
jgi:hypothetical protein